MNKTLKAMIDLEEFAIIYGLDYQELKEQAIELAQTTHYSFAEAAHIVSEGAVRKVNKECCNTSGFPTETLTRAYYEQLLLDPLYQKTLLGQKAWLEVQIENMKHEFMKHFPLCKLVRWMVERGEKFRG